MHAVKPQHLKLQLLYTETDIIMAGIKAINK